MVISAILKQKDNISLKKQAIHGGKTDCMRQDVHKIKSQR